MRITCFFNDFRFQTTGFTWFQVSQDFQPKTIGFTKKAIKNQSQSLRPKPRNNPRVSAPSLKKATEHPLIQSKYRVVFVDLGRRRAGAASPSARAHPPGLSRTGSRWTLLVALGWRGMSQMWTSPRVPRGTLGNPGVAPLDGARLRWALARPRSSIFGGLLLAP